MLLRGRLVLLRGCGLTLLLRRRSLALFWLRRLPLLRLRGRLSLLRLRTLLLRRRSELARLLLRLRGRLTLWLRQLAYHRWLRWLLPPLRLWRFALLRGLWLTLLLWHFALLDFRMLLLLRRLPLLRLRRFPLLGLRSDRALLHLRRILTLVWLHPRTLRLDCTLALLLLRHA